MTPPSVEFGDTLVGPIDWGGASCGESWSEGRGDIRRRRRGAGSETKRDETRRNGAGRDGNERAREDGDVRGPSPLAEGATISAVRLRAKPKTRGSRAPPAARVAR